MFNNVNLENCDAAHGENSRLFPRISNVSCQKDNINNYYTINADTTFS